MTERGVRSFTVYAAAIATVLVAGTTIWFVLGRQRTNEHLVQHTDEVLLRLAGVLADVVDSETAERGFVITGSPDSLTPYDAARQRLATDLDTLRELVSDNPRQLLNLGVLGQRANDELAALATVISLRSSDRASATAAVVAGDDKRFTDEIRTRIAEMSRTELDLLATRQNNATTADRVTVMIVLVVLAVLLLGLVWAARAAQLSAARSHVAEHDAARLTSEAALDRERRVRDDFREQFLGIVGHDLRAPLTAISVEAQMLRQPQSAADQRGAGERISSSTRRMSGMVNQLLDVTRSRLGSGIPLAPRRAELRATVNAAASEIARVHPDRIVVDATAEIEGTFDPDRIAQVVSNLVANAVTHGRGPVLVTLTERARTAILIVHNQGTPISAIDMPHVFEPFRTSRGESEGLGLGLFIADEIVRGHGGTIAVESSAEAGTSFTVALPLDQRHAD
jgi:signal transduction histidine kinase